MEIRQRNWKKQTDERQISLFDKRGFVMLCTALFIKPACISGIAWLRPLDISVNAARFAAVIYLISLFLKEMKRVKVDRTLWTVTSMLAFSAWEALSSVLNGIGISDWGLLLNSIGILLFSYMAVTINREVFVDGISKVLGYYVILNTLSVILFPGGMYESTKYKQNYFLDYRTAWFAIYLTAAAAVLLYHCEKKTRESGIRAALVIICEYISMALVWTATGLSCITIGGIFLAMWRRKDREAPGIIKILLVQAVIFYAVIIKRFQVYLSFFIVNVLNKDVTFTERTRIWDNALYHIKKHIVFGVGKRDASLMRQLLRYGASHPHCMYLYITLCFGLIGMLLYLISVITACGGKTIQEKKGENRILMAALVAMLTAAQVESFSATGAVFYPLFLLAAGIRVPYTEKKKERKIYYGRTGNPVYYRQFRDKTAGICHAEIPGPARYR